MIKRKSFSTRNRVILTPPKAGEESRKQQNILIAYLEDAVDRKAIQDTDLKKGKNFEKVVWQLGI